MGRLSKLGAALRWLLRSDAQRGVGRAWLFRTHTRLFREFTATRRIEVEDPENGLRVVRLDGVPFVWPAEADVQPLIHLLAELTTPGHPHDYDWGRTKLEPGDVVLDIGCCEGGFAAKAAECGATAIAVEPSQTMGRVIGRLFELRQLQPPRIERCLLGARASRAFFQDNPRDPAQSRMSDMPLPDSYEVPVLPLDELASRLPEKPTYLKCDAEGADYDILRGAEGFLREHHPKIAVTAYHHAEDFRRISDYLRSLGYTVEGKGIMYVAGDFRVVMIHAAV